MLQIPLFFDAKSGDQHSLTPEKSQDAEQSSAQTENPNLEKSPTDEHSDPLHREESFLGSYDTINTDSETEEPREKSTSEKVKEKLIQRINKYKTETTQLKKKNKELTEKIARMANLPLKDVISSIPVFSGKIEELEAFINTCSMLNKLVEHKAHLLVAIKAKISGEALAKIRPLDTLNTWELLRKRLNERLRKPVTFEYAQADLSNIIQKPNESLEEFAKRTKEKFRILNEASKKITEVEGELTILRKANKKLAITKFQQNLRNDKNVGFRCQQGQFG